MSDDIRNKAFGRLKDWSEHRGELEALGWPGSSATERMRERLHGGDASTVPGKFTAVESAVCRHARTLQTEQAVKALDADHRAVVKARFLGSIPLGDWAEAQGLTPECARQRLSRALDAVGLLLTKWNRREQAVDKSVTNLRKFVHGTRAASAAC